MIYSDNVTKTLRNSFFPPVSFLSNKRRWTDEEGRASWAWERKKEWSPNSIYLMIIVSTENDKRTSHVMFASNIDMDWLLFMDLCCPCFYATYIWVTVNLCLQYIYCYIYEILLYSDINEIKCAKNWTSLLFHS